MSGVNGLKRVPCQGPWTVLLRRSAGTERFDREYTDYKNGFGALNSDFWIGLQAMFYLTKRRKYMLRIDMWDSKGEYRFVKHLSKSF